MDHRRDGSSHTRVSDSNYFSQQAMRVGLIGGDSRGLVTNSDPLIDELHRELEKKRIREQIIMSEIMRKRQLEVEVRRELAIERQLALQRGDAFPIIGESSMWPHPTFTPFENVPQPRLHDAPRGVPFRSDKRPNKGTAEPPRSKALSQTLPVHNSLVITQVASESEELPFQRNPEAAKILEKNKLLLAAKPKLITVNLAGTKRKTIEGGKGEWTCTLCKVSATCEHSLKMHYQGKKHKANQEKLKKEEAKKMRKLSTGKKNIGASYKKDKRLENQVKRKLMAPSLRKKRFAFWCEDCQIGCHSEEVLNHHLKGKKHTARMEELKQAAVKQKDRHDVIHREGKENIGTIVGKEEAESDRQEEATKATCSLVNEVAKEEQLEIEDVKSTTEGTD